MTENNFMNGEYAHSQFPQNGFILDIQNKQHMNFADGSSAKYSGPPDDRTGGIKNSFEHQKYYSFNSGIFPVVDEVPVQNTHNVQNNYFPYTQTLQPYMWMPQYPQNQLYQQNGYMPYAYGAHQQSSNPYYYDYNQLYNPNKGYAQGGNTLTQGGNNILNQGGNNMNQGSNSILNQGMEAVNNTQKKEGVPDISPLNPKFNPQQTQNHTFNGNYMVHSFGAHKAYMNAGELSGAKYVPSENAAKAQIIPKPVYSNISKTDGVYGINIDAKERAELLEFLKNRRLKKAAKSESNSSSSKSNSAASKTKTENLWSENVSSALDLAITCIPKDDFNRIRLSHKQFGRNELISMYIYVTTGERRKIKQISSHLQVWKKRLVKDLNKLNEVMKHRKLGKYAAAKKEADVGESGDSTQKDLEKDSSGDSGDYGPNGTIFEAENNAADNLNIRASQKLLNDFNIKLFLTKNDLFSDEDIVSFCKMTTLIFNLLEYGILKSDFSVLRFKEEFYEVEQMLSKGQLDKM